MLGNGNQAQKEEKPYQTCLDHMKFYQGKNVIITGGTGAIGSKVVKKLLKAGKQSFEIL
jgi:FlaA1/EpsC-like NDP-sugar epimerase